VSFLIKNATIIRSTGRQTADVKVKEGNITTIGENLDPGDSQIIDATGLWLLPGLIDLHCHLRDPGYEYKEDIISGTRAASAGGFTGVLCMANTLPVNDNAAVTEYIVKRSLQEGSCRVYPVGAVSKRLEGSELAEMGCMRQVGAVAFSDDGRPVTDGRLMDLALRYADGFGSYIISHPEDLSLSQGGVMNRGVTSSLLGLPGIPRSAEEVMIARDIRLAEETGCRVHIAHLSTKGGVDLVRAGKARGVNVTCETTPHYLCLTDICCEGYDTAAKVSPPLREESDRLGLIEGLVDRTIDAIATDHAPHHIDDKQVEFSLAASGISGFETAFAACYTQLVKPGILPIERLVELMSVIPAAIAGISGGTVETGDPADFILTDGEPWTVRAADFLSKGKNTPFKGRQLFGRVRKTFLGGRIVYDAEVKA
jgi:dihydroorotase